MSRRRRCRSLPTSYSRMAKSESDPSRNWFLVTDTEARALAAGTVPKTVRVQARQILEPLDAYLARTQQERAADARTARRRRA